LEHTPDPSSPAVVLASAQGPDGGSFNDVIFDAGTYYAVVSTWPSPMFTEFTLNLSFAPHPQEPEFSINPSEHDFGLVQIGTDSMGQEFIISNIGGGLLTIAPEDIFISGVASGEFTLLNISETVYLAGGQSASVSVLLSPNTIGSKNAILQIEDNIVLARNGENRNLRSRESQQIPLSGDAFDSTVFEFPWTEDFEGLSLGEMPLGWIRNAANWGAANTSYAGGGAPELTFNWLPSATGTFIALSPPLDTTDKEELMLSFRHSLSNVVEDFSVKVMTIYGENEAMVNEWTNDGFGARVFETNLTNESHGIGSSNLRIAWVFTGNSSGINYWAIDDITVWEPVPLETPSNLVAYTGDGLVHLNWDPPVLPTRASDDEESLEIRNTRNMLFGYNVYRNGVLLNSHEVLPVNFYSDHSASHGVSYQYHVTAVYDIGESRPSNIVEITALLLNHPQNLAATALHSRVDLEWEAPVPQGLAVLSYNVYRDGVMINADPVTALVYEDNDVINGQTYQYYVTAIYDEGESGESNTASATPYALNAPQNLAATALHSRVELDWEAPVPQGLAVLSYKVYRDGVMINADPVTGLVYEDNDVVNGQIYQYYVTAMYDEGESGHSNTVTALPSAPIVLDPPQNLTISVSAGVINLSWNEVPGATSYKVYCSSSPQGEFIEDTSGTFNNNTWSAPVNSEKKFYFVTAVSE